MLAGHPFRAPPAASIGRGRCRPRTGRRCWPGRASCSSCSTGRPACMRRSTSSLPGRRLSRPPYLHRQHLLQALHASRSPSGTPQRPERILCLCGLWCCCQAMRILQGAFIGICCRSPACHLGSGNRSSGVVCTELNLSGGHRRSRSASSSKGFAVPLLESLMSASPRAVAKRTAALPAALTIGCQAVEGPAASLSSSQKSGAAALENGFAPPTADLASPSTQPPSSSTLSEMSTPGSMQMESLSSLAVRSACTPCLCLGAS